MKFTIPIAAKPFVMLTQKTKFYAKGKSYAEYKDTCYQYMMINTNKDERGNIGKCEYLWLSIVCYLPILKTGKLTGVRGDATNLLKAIEDGICNGVSCIGNDKKNLKVTSEIRGTNSKPHIEVEILEWKLIME